jgi:hypothetical protein
MIEQKAASKTLTLELLPNTLAVCKLDPTHSIPKWATSGEFYSVSKTPDELSIVCDNNAVPEDVKAEREWRCFKVKGPLDFSLTGIFAALANPLAQAGISIFAISTFDTDYLMVKNNLLNKAVQILLAVGHSVEDHRKS